MASARDLKKRIATVKNTQQTTKAMKMVSAAKLRRAQDAISAQRPFARAIGSLMSRLASVAGKETGSKLIAGSDAVVGGRVLVVMFTSDRGLCGGFNSNVIKGVSRWAKENQSRYSQITYAFVGKRGYDFFKSRKVDRGQYFEELGGKVTYAKAKKLADTLVRAYLDGDYDEIMVVYNEFQNAITQVTRVETFLPLSPTALGSSDALQNAGLENTIVKPSPKAVFEALLDKYFAIQAFRVMLESQASEHGARMSAMDNATRNASDMIFALSLEYNKQRQAGITKELLEIISGSEAQKAG